MAATAAALFVAFWICVGLSIAWVDYRAYRRAGPLHGRPTPIAELEDGREAKLVGTVRLAEQGLKAPVSGRPCAGWVMRVARRSWLRWKPLKTDRRATGFYLDDGTGEVFVPLDDANVRVSLVTGARYTTRRRGKIRRALRAVLGEVRQAHPRARIRCDEGAIVEGTRVAVYGRVRRRPDARPEKVEAYRTRPYAYVLEAADEGLHLSDDRAALG
ncbi:MAG TPA: hypothetical protein RMH85_08195 [Polyangiaceae bacterium LLY-WYZ-15_(1-7)]|nr:hypothetical protein [Myxococcales bacterium]MAT24118.1 hypothetical protein [Sandaracinus sp.]HJL03075.1 hypothetical protein [Polyangiaceae bacterium LLY-WYZ-15_(1-7)]HJL08463.1 hypothetical protein [Polyangiaceae bacterium LLY-WYZ-15_(1-7)]HJL25930.1 hypothetical protein [Polyangiaceae bacterium LLY-WYZ-15_(1-7)]